MGGGPSKPRPRPGDPDNGGPSPEDYSDPQAGIRRRSVDDSSGLDKVPDLFSLRDEGNVHLCSASLIHPLLLLTAAHCILGKSLKGMKAVRVDQTLDLIRGAEQSLAISHIMVHPDFDRNTMDNDIALLRLDDIDALQHDSSAARISPTPPLTWKIPKTVILAGWDLDQTTTAGEQSPSVYGAYKVRTSGRPDCLALYEGDDEWNRTVTNNMFCAWYAGEDSCQEIESGSLLLCGTDTWYTCGIGSWGYGCGTDDLPMVYTDVSKYRPWIDMHMRNVMRN